MIINDEILYMKEEEFIGTYWNFFTNVKLL